MLTVLAQYRWFRRLVGGTWRRDLEVERYNPDVGRVSMRWIEQQEKERDEEQ